jgi:hypothetical protein
MLMPPIEQVATVPGCAPLGKGEFHCPWKESEFSSQISKV